ncbi:MAG: glycosyltransferase family 2 protein [Chthoniobacterales bacterium]|nr:glycosyltransferase family 2 protein [Chthoniobacterales bacterium]MCX7713743.1 glycosyltransferase family 2 protein [Chthoniobacterales bacterium]
MDEMITVMIPVYNERATLEELYKRIRAVLEEVGRPWELLFINDGSNDGSGEILNSLAKADQHVKVIHFRRNFGQTAAMMAGFDYASGGVIIPMDGDLQNDPSDIPKLLEKLDEGYDVCSGWRKDRKDDAIRRNLPSIMANRLISWVSGVRLHDFGCSLKAYRAEVIKGVRLYGEMHRFLPIYAKWHGARITEVTVNHFPRVSGKSKYGLERVLKVLADLITVKFLDKFALKPMYLFGFCGLIGILMSALFGGWALWRVISMGEPFIKNPLLMLSVFSGMTGVLCLLMGLLAEMITRTFYESQGKSIYLIRETRNLSLRKDPYESAS